MAKYIMNDGFEFVTDQSQRVVASRRKGFKDYQKEDLPIYVDGSPVVGDYLHFRADNGPPGQSPTRVTSIDPDFALEG